MRTDVRRFLRPSQLGLVAILLLGITIAVAYWRPRRASSEASAAGRRAEVTAGPAVREESSSRMAVERPSEAAGPPAPTAGPAAAQGGRAVRVRDVAGLPVAGAEVHLVPDEPGRARTGSTDAEGLWRFSADDLPADLVVRHPSFATRLVRTTRADPEVILVVLRRAVRITGTVEARRAALPAVGLVVHAIPDTHTSVLDRPGRTAEILRRAPRGEVGGDGRFEITDLDPTAAYDLLAGGAGFLSASPFRWTIEHVGDVHLVVDRVVGILVHVRDSQGEPIRTCGSFHWQGGAFLPRFLREARVTPCAGAMADLAGVDVPEPGSVRPEDELLLFVDQGGNPLPIGPVEFRANFPGYEEVRESVWLEAAFPELSQVWLAATPLFDGLGELSVEFAGLGTGTPSPPTMVSLSLLPISGGPVLERFFGVPGRDSFSLRLEAVPSGVYELRTTAFHGQFLYPEVGVERVAISPDGAAAVRIDGSRCGRVRLRLIRPDGSAYDGEVSVEVSPAQGNRAQAGTLVFDGPPYGIPLLPAGIYRFDLLRPEAARDEAVQAEVRAGREVEVAFRL